MVVSGPAASRSSGRGAGSQAVRPWRPAIRACLGGLLAGSPALALDPARAPTQYAHDAWTTRDGLPQTTVHSVVQTPDGYLWLGTQVGLVRFDGVRFSVFDKSNSGLRHNHIWALLVARDGALWMGTEGGASRG